MASLDILIPSGTSPLYYSGGADSTDNSSTTGTVAKLTVTFKYPSVVLDHSIYVTSICSNTSLTATFNSSAAFTQAQSSWPNTTFILVTSACTTDGQNGIFLATSVSFSGTALTAIATGSVVELVDVFDDMGLDFGAIPSGTSSNSTANSTTTATNTCGTPNTSSINGLPAVACGPSFDQSLDDYLGYYSGDDANLTVNYHRKPSQVHLLTSILDGACLSCARSAYQHHTTSWFSFKLEEACKDRGSRD